MERNQGPADGKHSFRINDPAQLGPQLAPVAWGVSAEHVDNGLFAADFQTAKLQNLGIFAVRLENARISRVPADYIAVTVPLDEELRFFDRENPDDFSPGAAHILWHGHSLNLEIVKPSSMLVATYPIRWLREIWGSATVAELDRLAERGNAISLETKRGRTYWRNLNYVWSEISRGAVFLDARGPALAVENCQAELFRLAIEGDAVGSFDRIMTPRPNRTLERVELYIREHLSEDLTLDELVTVAETSASSLLRTFKLHRHTTPMRYVKQLRLEAVHRSLLAADAGDTKVSDLAADYGFFQFGRFASDYKRAFGELPSETLRI